VAGIAVNHIDTVGAGERQQAQLLRVDECFLAIAVLQTDAADGDFVTEELAERQPVLRAALECNDQTGVVASENDLLERQVRNVDRDDVFIGIDDRVVSVTARKEIAIRAPAAIEAISAGAARQKVVAGTAD